jgi:hypothetical protein
LYYNNWKKDILKMSLKSSIEERIVFSNNPHCTCVEDGDTAGAEAWAGYTSALRWVLSLIEQPQPQDVAPAIEMLEKRGVWSDESDDYTKPVFDVEEFGDKINEIIETVNSLVLKT